MQVVHTEKYKTLPRRTRLNLSGKWFSLNTISNSQKLSYNDNSKILWNQKTKDNPK